MKGHNPESNVSIPLDPFWGALYLEEQEAAQPRDTAEAAVLPCTAVHRETSYGSCGSDSGSDAPPPQLQPDLGCACGVKDTVLAVRLNMV